MNTTTISEQSTRTQRVKVLYTAKTHMAGGREGGASGTAAFDAKDPSSLETKVV